MGFEIFYGFSFVFTFLPIVLVFGLVVVMALHRDDDASGNRSMALYAALVASVGFFLLLIAAPVIGGALVNFSRETYGGRHQAEASQLAIGVILALVGAGILLLHRPLYARMRIAGGAAARVRRAYALVMCFVVILVGAVAASLALYEGLRVVASDTFGSDRGDAARSFVPAIALLIAAVGIGRWHWDEAEINATAAP
jgi:hypothetical protein